MNRVIVLWSMIAAILAGCKDDPLPVLPPDSIPTTKGVYVLNEGDFGDPTGARLTFYDPVTDSVFKNVYENANDDQSLGSLGDDMILSDGKLYITMSGSGEIKVLDIQTHKVLQTKLLIGEDPHDLCIDKQRSRLYVTRLFKNSLFVLNLTDLSVLDSITVGTNPLGMRLVDSLLFVCNSGYGNDNRVSIINVNTNEVTKTVQVGYGPSSAVVHGDKVYVACSGNAFTNPAVNGSVYSISIAAKSVVDTIAIDENLLGISGIGTDGMMYVAGSASGSFYGGPIHKIDLAMKTVMKNFISGTYYGLGIDEANGDFYLADAKNFASDGEVNIYSKNGQYVKKFSAQRGPAVFAFKR